jgi:hypothetical protein
LSFFKECINISSPPGMNSMCISNHWIWSGRVLR